MCAAGEVVEAAACLMPSEREVIALHTCAMSSGRNGCTARGPTPANTCTAAIHRMRQRCTAGLIRLLLIDASVLTQPMSRIALHNAGGPASDLADSCLTSLGKLVCVKETPSNERARSKLEMFKICYA